MDLVGRKLPMRGGGVYQDQVARMRATLAELEAGRRGRSPSSTASSAAAIDTLERGHEVDLEHGLADPVRGPVGGHALPAAVRHRRRAAG